jgi:hypothetical protein
MCVTNSEGRSDASRKAQQTTGSTIACERVCRELTHPNVVITYDYGWTSHEINSLLSVRPESVVMVILMEYCNLKSLAYNICCTNRFGHQSGDLKWSAIAHTLSDILPARY